MNKLLRQTFLYAVRKLEPSSLIRKNVSIKNNILYIKGEQTLNLKKYSRVFVCGEGKGSVKMAEGVIEIFKDRITGGIVVSKTLNKISSDKIKLLEGSHPYPDLRSLNAGRALHKLISGLNEDALLIFLTSGGGSSLAVYPAEGITLDDKIKTQKLLINSGAGISEINCVRKKISRIKGGKLAEAAYPAAVINLIISDVAGDDTSVISSGPFTKDKTAYTSPLSIIKRYGLKEKIPESVISSLKEKTIKRKKSKGKENIWFENVNNVIIGNNLTALSGAESFLNKKGFNTLILSSLFEGEVRAMAKFHSDILKEALKSGNPLKLPFAIISGGEAVVNVSGKGKGGRNMEFALHFIEFMEDYKQRWTLLSAGTDGIDGITGAAGVIVDEKTADIAKEKKLKISKYLKNNDSYSFFKKTGGLLITGDTGTNASDIRVIVCTN